MLKNTIRPALFLYYLPAMLLVFIFYVIEFTLSDDFRRSAIDARKKDDKNWLKRNFEEPIVLISYVFWIFAIVVTFISILPVH